MRIWELTSDEKNITFTYENENDYRKNIEYFDGRSMVSTWIPFKLKTLNKGTKRDVSSYPRGVAIFIGRTKDALDPLIGHDVEYLPVFHDELHINLVNILKIVDCVDIEKSHFNRFDDGKIMSFRKIVFNSDRVDHSSNIFKIPEKRSHIFVSDSFRDQVLQAKLKGFVFTEVWNSETTEEMEQERQDRYNAKLAEIENIKGPRLSYSDAIKIVESGGAVAHKQWKMQLDKDGVKLHGILKEECSYQWIDPVYIPPIFLEIEWVEVEESDI